MKFQQIVAVVLLVSLMFGAGMHLRRGDLMLVLKNYGLLARALVANFIVVPLVAVLIVRALHVDDSIATGILLMAIAPGVPFVVLAGGRAKGGSDELAIELAIVMQLLAVITIPLLAALVLPAKEIAALPPGSLVKLLAFQFVPLVLGGVLAAFAPRVANKLEKPDGIVTLIALIALLGTLAPAVLRSLAALFGTFGLLAILLVTLISLATGWLLGFGRLDQRRTLAIGTVLRNPAIAAVIATASFPGTRVLEAVIAYFVIQAVVAAVAAAKLPHAPAS